MAYAAFTESPGIDPAGRRAGEADARSRPRPSRKRFWFRVHSFIGLKLSLFLAFVCLTGTVAVFSDEIDWLLNPAMRVAPSSAGDEVRWDRVANALAAHAPDGIVDTIEAPQSPIFAVGAYLTREDGGTRVIYLHPATGEVQGEGTMLTAKTLLRRIHRHLLLPETIGILIVTALGFFLLASLVTAMLFHKTWWKGFFRPIRWRDARTAWGDAHRLAGAWSVAFGLLITGTGIWYFVEAAGAPAPRFEQPMLDNEKLTNAEAARLLPAALAAARAAYPELAIRRVDWPGEYGVGFGFYGQDGTLLVRPRASGIVIGARAGKIALMHRGGEASAYQRISEAADPLHMGFFAGYWSKALWFAFGLILTLLAFSGAVVSAKRLARGEASAPAGRRGRSTRFALRGRLGIALLLAAASIGAVLWQLPGAIASLR